MKTFLARNQLLIFFLLAFIFSWLFWSPGVAGNLGLIEFDVDGTVLTFLGGFGPLVAALVVMTASGHSEGAPALLRSMFDWRVKPRWWAASVLLLAALFGISAALNIMAGGKGPDPAAGVFLQGGNLTPVIFLLLISSFGEEAGWRGFALPKLQATRSPMKATLLLTLVWWIWHLPMYWLLPAAMNSVQQFGFFAAFGVQLIVLMALGVLCAWVYNGSGGVVLMPVLLHVGWNLWSGAFGQEASAVLLPLFLLTAICVSLLTKGKLGLPASPYVSETRLQQAN